MGLAGLCWVAVNSPHARTERVVHSLAGFGIFIADSAQTVDEVFLWARRAHQTSGNIPEREDVAADPDGVNLPTRVAVLELVPHVVTRIAVRNRSVQR